MPADDDTMADGAVNGDVAVELWCESLSRWVHGFELVERLDADRYLVRRRSDHCVLPEPFIADNIRAL